MNYLDFLEAKGYSRFLITDVAAGVKFIKKYGKKRLGCLSPDIQQRIIDIINSEHVYSGPGM